MNSAPKISNSLAQQLNLIASTLLPTLPAATAASPPLYTPAPDVAAVLKRLIESEDDQELTQAAAAWRASAANPLRHQPVVKRTVNWRKQRGLAIDSPKEKKVFFGASKSGNFLLLANGADSLSRADFYVLALDLFAKAVAAMTPGTDPAKWKALADAFMKDDAEKSGWPADNKGLKASQFAQQLLRDCLTAEMGMLDGPPPADPPLLKALGEHRRSGNHYTREDAELRRNELIKELQKTPGA